MSDWYLGEIRVFGGTFAPVGWAFCDGQLLSISENDALYALIGTTYGGDGQSTFALPDLRGRSPLHQGTITGATGTSYQLGEEAGTEQVTLTTQQIPAHTHVPAAAASPTTAAASGAIWSAQPQSGYSTTTPTAQLAGDSVQPAGGSQPHDNMPPYLATSYIIATTGIYPTPS
ncbi:phage tail protein [Agromyces soli]